MWIYACDSLSEESEDRQKEDGGDVGEGGQTVGDSCEMGCVLRARVLGVRLSRIGSCLATAVVRVK